LVLADVRKCFLLNSRLGSP